MPSFQTTLCFQTVFDALVLGGPAGLGDFPCRGRMDLIFCIIATIRTHLDFHYLPYLRFYVYLQIGINNSYSTESIMLNRLTASINY